MFLIALKFLQWPKCHPQTKQMNWCAVMNPCRCRQSWFRFSSAAQTASLPASSKAARLMVFLIQALIKGGFPRPGRSSDKLLQPCQGQQRPRCSGRRVWSPDSCRRSAGTAHQHGPTRPNRKENGRRGAGLSPKWMRWRKISCVWSLSEFQMCECP